VDTAAIATLRVDTAAIAKVYLLYFILPLRVGAGIADWFCHRAARIDLHGGATESVIHLVMLAEAGIAILAGLFFEITSLTLAIMLAAWAAHEVTAYWDLHFATAHRRITAIEQRVHDYLGVIPLLALSFIMVIHWPVFLAVFGLGDRPADWRLVPRAEGFPLFYLVPLGAMMALNLALYVEELYRGVKARARAVLPA
jgi:hypothetical protein